MQHKNETEKDQRYISYGLRDGGRMTLKSNAFGWAFYDGIMNRPLRVSKFKL